jgi:hypothetical protein
MVTKFMGCLFKRALELTEGLNALKCELLNDLIND